MRFDPPIAWLPVACAAMAAPWSHAAAPQAGQVVVLALQSGEGARGLSVLLDGADIASTNGAGTATLSISPGTHRLAVLRGTVPVYEAALDLGAGAAAELVIRLGEGSAPIAKLDVFPAAAPGKGRLSGRVTDEKGDPVAGASVGVEGAGVEARTDADGRFEIEVPRGVWDVRVAHPSKALIRTFGAQRVSPHLDHPLEFALTERRPAPTGAGIEEVLATARYVPETSTSLERTSESVLDAISEQDIALSGDSDAAAALARVTGVTILNDRVFVRGLGDRYSSTYVNRGVVPSPDPSRRAIGLDIFPTDILGGISVQKTYSADLPGDFSGGVVLLQTRGIPDGFQASLGSSLGGNARSTSKEGLGYAGGDDDWQGRDDGSRELSSVARELTDNGRKPFFELTPEEVEQVGDSLPNVFDAGLEQMEADRGLDLAVSDRYTGWDFADIGWGVTMVYDAKTRFRKESRVNLGPTPSGTPLVVQFEERERTEEGVDASGIASLALAFSEAQSIEYTGILSRLTTKGTFFSDSRTTENASSSDQNDHAYTLDWIENQLLSHQLLGSHVVDALGGLKVEWQVTTADASSDTLDRREYRFRRSVSSPPEEPFRLVTAGSNPRRTWQFLDDRSEDAGLDLSLPVKLPLGVAGEVKAGVRRTDRTRSFDQVGWAYELSSAAPVDVQLTLGSPSLEQILDPQYVRPDGWSLTNAVTQVPGASNADSYRASQDIWAWYAMTDFYLTPSLQLVLGMREEESTIAVGLADPGSETPTASSLGGTDRLPAATLSWYVNDRHTIRAGYSETLNHPQFREIAPIPYRDPETRDQSFGNPNLESATLSNYDLRYEYYWNGSEGVTAALFFKDIQKPIEVNVGADGVGNPFLTFVNAKSAEVYGLELDVRWEFDELASVWDPLSSAYIASNLSLIESKVEVGQPGVDSRQLQGQSPWILNLTLGYKDDLAETDVALLFNMFGDRVVAVGQQIGTSRLPDAEELKAPTLDLKVGQRLFDRWKVGLKLRNILDPEIRRVQGGETTLSYRTGMSGSLSVEYEF